MIDLEKTEYYRKKLIEKFGMDSLRILYTQLIHIVDPAEYQRELETLVS